MADTAKKAVRTWLTTPDNPYDPFKDFDKWNEFDTDHGYCTAGLIARLMPDEEIPSDNEFLMVQNEVIDRIIDHVDFEGNYFKVKFENGLTIPPVKGGQLIKDSTNRKDLSTTENEVK